MDNKSTNLRLPSLFLRHKTGRNVTCIKVFILAIALLLLFSYLFFFYVHNSGLVYREKLMPESMKADAEYLISTLKANHPEMKEGQTAFDGIIGEINKKISEPMSTEDFYWTLNTLIVALKDGHTHISSDQVNRDIIDLPPLEWTTGGLIVKEGMAGFKRGDKIVSIGGMDQRELLNKLEGLIPAEVTEWVKANVNVISEGMYLRRLQLVDKDSNVIVRYERNGSVLTAKMHIHKSGKSVFSNVAGTISRIKADKLKWEIDHEHGLGLITINTCPSGQGYIKGFKEFFHAVHENNIETIAVDLRKNDGGSDLVINQFLSFIDVQYYAFIGGGTYSNSPEQYRKVGKNDPPMYKGKIYLFTSNSTFSAATDFTVVLQANSIAKVIGQPTGNTKSFFGNTKYFCLPNCKLGFNCATTKNKAPVSDNEQGKTITPDYLIQYTRQDILDNRDPYLNFVKNLVRKK